MRMRRILPKVWVVDTRPGQEPTLAVHEVSHETPAFYMVVNGDYFDPVKKHKNHQHCFSSEVEAIAHLRQHYASTREAALRTAERMSNLLALSDSQILVEAMFGSRPSK